MPTPQDLLLKRIIDGDTFDTTDGVRHRIGEVNTPESKNVGGPQATQALARILADGGTVTPSGEHDDYGRSISSARTADGQNVAYELVRQGRALPFKKNDPWADAGMYAGALDVANGTAVADPQLAADFKEGVWREGSLGPRAGRPQGNTFQRAMGRGYDNTQATLFGFTKAIGDATGIDYISTIGEEGMEKNLKEAFANPASITSVDDVDSLDDMWTFAVEGLGEQIPQLLGDAVMALTGAGVGAVVARRAAMKSLTRTLGPQFVENWSKRKVADTAVNGYLAEAATILGKATARGRVTGTRLGALSSIFPQGAGETNIGLTAEGITAPWTAFGVGALKSVLEYLPLEHTVKSISKISGMNARSVGAIVGRITGMAGIEGTTESVQTIMDIAARNHHQGRDLMDLSPEDWEEVRTSGAKGAVVGGGITTAGAIPPAYRAARAKVLGTLNSREQSRQAGREVPDGSTPSQDMVDFNAGLNEGRTSPAGPNTGAPSGTGAAPVSTGVAPATGSETVTTREGPEVISEQIKALSEGKTQGVFISRADDDSFATAMDFVNSTPLKVKAVLTDTGMLIAPETFDFETYQKADGVTRSKMIAEVKNYTQDKSEVKDPETAKVVKSFSKNGVTVQDEIVDADRVDETVAKQAGQYGADSQQSVTSIEQALAEREAAATDTGTDTQTGSAPVVAQDTTATSPREQRLDQLRRDYAETENEMGSEYDPGFSLDKTERLASIRKEGERLIGISDEEYVAADSVNNVLNMGREKPIADTGAGTIEEAAAESAAEAKDAAASDAELKARVDRVLARIAAGDEHHSSGDHAFGMLADMYAAGEFLIYENNEVTHKVPFDSRIMETAVGIYEKNLAYWEKRAELGLGEFDAGPKELRAAKSHTDNVGRLYSAVAEAYLAGINTNTQLDADSITDGTAFELGEFSWEQTLRATEGDEVTNPYPGICLTTAPYVAYALRKAGLPSTTAGMGQKDFSGFTDKSGDHYVALTEINGVSYIVDQPQGEIFEPLTPPKANTGTLTDSKFRPRFIENTPENVAKFYGGNKIVAPTGNQPLVSGISSTIDAALEKYGYEAKTGATNGQATADTRDTSGSTNTNDGKGRAASFSNDERVRENGDSDTRFAYDLEGSSDPLEQVKRNVESTVAEIRAMVYALVLAEHKAIAGKRPFVGSTPYQRHMDAGNAYGIIDREGRVNRDVAALAREYFKNQQDQAPNEILPIESIFTLIDEEDSADQAARTASVGNNRTGAKQAETTRLGLADKFPTRNIVKVEGKDGKGILTGVFTFGVGRRLFRTAEDAKKVAQSLEVQFPNSRFEVSKVTGERAWVLKRYEVTDPSMRSEVDNASHIYYDNLSAIVNNGFTALRRRSFKRILWMRNAAGVAVPLFAPKITIMGMQIKRNAENVVDGFWTGLGALTDKGWQLLHEDGTPLPAKEGRKNGVLPDIMRGLEYNPRRVKDTLDNAVKKKNVGKNSTESDDAILAKLDKKFAKGGNQSIIANKVAKILAENNMDADSQRFFLEAQSMDSGMLDFAHVAAKGEIGAGEVSAMTEANIKKEDKTARIYDELTGVVLHPHSDNTHVGGVKRSTKGGDLVLTERALAEDKEKQDTKAHRWLSRGAKERAADAKAGGKFPSGKRPVNIWHSSGENAELSNLAERIFTYAGQRYLSVEHAYQTWKSGTFDKATFDKYTKAGQKIIGRLGTQTENNWNVDLMGKLIRASFRDSIQAQETLLATGVAPLTHKQDKGIWAKEFPRILMEVRAELAAVKAKPTKGSVTVFGELPAGIERFAKAVLKVLKINSRIVIVAANDKAAVIRASKGVTDKVVLKELNSFIAGTHSGTVRGRVVPTLEGTTYILLPSKTLLSRIQTIKILGHEIGHIAFRKANRTILAKHKDVLVEEFHIAKSKRKGGQYLLADEAKAFEEWFADQFSAWLVQNGQDKLTRLGKIMKELGDLMAKVYKNIMSVPNARIGQVTPGFNAFMAELMTDKKKAFNNVLDDNSPAEYNTTTVADAVHESVGNTRTRQYLASVKKFFADGDHVKMLPFVFTADRELRSMGAIGKQLADMFSQQSSSLKTGIMAGFQSYFQGVANSRNKWNQQWDQLIVKIGDQKRLEAALAEMAAADDTADPATLSPDAKLVNDFFQQFNKSYLAGRLGNKAERALRIYFPRMFDLEQAESRRAELIKLLVENVKVNVRDRERLWTSEQQEQADVERTRKMTEVVDRIIASSGSPDFDFSTGTVATPGFSARHTRDLRGANLNKVLKDAGFLMANDADIVRAYIASATKYGEFARISEGVNGQTLTDIINSLPSVAERERARLAIEGYMGRIGLNSDRRAVKAMSWIMVAESYVTLMFAALASLPDLVGPVIRSRDLDNAKVAFKAVLGALGNMDNARERAKLIGVLNERMSLQALKEAYGQSKASAGAQRAMDKLFIWNGQEALTNFTRVISLAVGEEFLINNAARSVRGDVRATRYLKELNVTAEQVQQWDAEGRKAWSPDHDTANSNAVQDALYQFIDESVLRPNASQRPIWANHPMAMLLWHLKSFFWAYGKVILGGMAREAQSRYKESGSGIVGKLGEAAVPFAIGGLMLLPFAALARELREVAQYWDDEAPTDREDLLEYTWGRMGDAGMFGPFELVSGATRFSGDPTDVAASLAGPAFQHMTHFAENGFSWASLKRVTPIMNQVPWLNDYVKDAVGAN